MEVLISLKIVMERETLEEADNELPIKSQNGQPTSVDVEVEGEIDVESCTILLKEVDRVEKELESIISRRITSFV